MRSTLPHSSCPAFPRINYRAVQYAGFTCTPLIGGWLSYLLRDRVIHISGKNGLVVLDEFTAPAFFLASAAVAVLGLLWLVFRDSDRAPSGEEIPAGSRNGSASPDISGAKDLMQSPSDVSFT